MSVQSSPATPIVSPAQVWARLAADLQARAIRLMAQLAFNLVAAQSDLPIREAHYASLSHPPQNPA
jgi:hypothetical protein